MGNLYEKQKMGEVHDMSYYQKCMMGGILSCGITHTMVCPLDIVKCRMQVSSRSTWRRAQNNGDSKNISVSTYVLSMRIYECSKLILFFLFRPCQDFTPEL